MSAGPERSGFARGGPENGASESSFWVLRVGVFRRPMGWRRGSRDRSRIRTPAIGYAGCSIGRRILRILEHPLQCPDADAEYLRCGVLVAVGLGQHTVDVVALELCERRPDVTARAGGRKRLDTEVRFRDGRRLGERGRALDHVFQLTYVARPSLLREPRERFGGETIESLSEGRRHTVEEVLGEKWH